MALKFLDKSAKIEMTDVYYVQLTLGDGTVYENVELRRLLRKRGKCGLQFKQRKRQPLYTLAV